MTIAVGSLVTVGCTSNPVKRVVHPPVPTPKIAVKPTDNAADVPISTEIAAQALDGTIDNVAFTDGTAPLVAHS